MINNSELDWFAIRELPGRMCLEWTWYESLGPRHSISAIPSVLRSGAVPIRGQKLGSLSFERIEHLIDDQSISESSCAIGQVSLPNKDALSIGWTPKRIDFHYVEVDWNAFQQYVEANVLPSVVPKAKGKNLIAPSDNETPQEFVSRARNGSLPAKEIAAALDKRWPNEFTDEALGNLLPDKIGRSVSPDGARKQGQRLRGKVP